MTLPRIRKALLQKRYAATEAAAIRKKAIAISGAPSAIGAVPDRGVATPEDHVFSREIGCTRRIFQLKPFLTTSQLEGLAYRIRTLTKNEALNSILIATDSSHPEDGLPSMLHDRNYPFLQHESVDEGFPPQPDHKFYVSGGYDPLTLYQQSAERVQMHLSHLMDVALAVRGSSGGSKIPTISVPHGHFHDGAFALFGMGTYVLATRETSFSITNPSKGLSLDPVGLSYILPRLGQEFNQPSANYTGCGMIMALMGYKANAEDMMEVGLATNYVETPRVISLLENTLSQLPPWNQQALIKNPIQYHGELEPTHDHNAEFRNYVVAEAIHNFSSYRADGADIWTTSDRDAFLMEKDPSLELDHVPWHSMRSSNLVDYAATFDAIFKTETTLMGIHERLKEIAGRVTNDPEEQEGIDVASDFCRRLESQSPLAVSAVYRLLREGTKPLETLQSCMEREKLVQTNLYTKEDFAAWAKARIAGQVGEAFSGWKHRSIHEVSDDEVTELVESPKLVSGRTRLASIGKLGEQ
ncbi:hypothetical protein FisN_13Lh226 [Fistulifera solaris]|uniref:3-hydroxyisobutyryl-CoA hydrolase n=1 Tax=Fistulifera solaris TaxID=1519565 RepID=A0A1Z5KMQ2_FISSO|nr:hypothetical protein FisN_13Lh226 [Fistulifera solaris]|eukprot:GAX27218.1 hypothetical protein FisN_13Lh226 [Fistulifera solaris]